MYITRPSFAQGGGSRAYELKRGDEIYFNIAAIKQFGYNYELSIGEDIYLMELPAKVIKRKTRKKYPNKKWWQFWLKQEEYIDGYILMIL